MASKKIMVDIMVVDKNATRTINKATTAIDGMAQATNRASVAANKNKTNSGLNNAIIAESARLASDASYGFTAIANNLGQLVSLFDASRRAAGGLTEAIAALFTKQALFLISIQLLITYGKTLYDALMGLLGANKLLTETFKEASETVSSTNGNFTIYIKTLQDATKSEEEHKDAVKGLNKEFPDYISNLKKANVSIEDVKNKTKEAKIQNDLYRESIKKLALSRAASNKITDEESKRLQKQIDTERELLEDYGLTLKQAREEVVKIEENRTRAGIGVRKANLIQLVKDLDEEDKLRNDNIDRLFKYVNIETSTNKDSASLRKDFVAGRLNFEKEIIESENRIADSLVINKDRQIEIEAERIKELARLRQLEFARRQQERVDSIKNPEDKAKAQIKANIAIANSEQSLYDYINQIDEETSRKISQRRLDDSQKSFSLFRKGLNELMVATEAFGVAVAENDFNRLDRQRNLEKAKTKSVIDGLEEQKRAAELAGESTLGIDQKIFNEREKLRQTESKLDADVADAKLATANYVAQAITAIAGEGSAIGKAVSVAMATMNTYEATTAALGSKPYGPWNIAQAAATAAFGFLQVRKILATKLPAGGGTGGGTGGAAVQAPAFNVVGASETSQLGMALGQSQTEQVVNVLWSDIELKNVEDDRQKAIVGF